ncbi:hypothetical protein HY772_02800 [Candidatus Woesearchaeota archaeon]|nr:hypothetical protein [Candidatus Woesearchaeota archaeon]
MHIPKRYGQSKVELCPFCGKQASTENKNGVPVCIKHKNDALQDLKCLCGEYLMPKSGKYGAFFVCLTCGPMNLRKALEINEGGAPTKTLQQEPQPFNIQKPINPRSAELKKKFVPKEITVRSDDPEYFA